MLTKAYDEHCFRGRGQFDDVRVLLKTRVPVEKETGPLI